MAFSTKSRLTEEDYANISQGLTKHDKMAQEIGFEATVYFILAGSRKEFIQKPNSYLRSVMGISRGTEWRYRKLLEEKGYL